jgi:hypothetical protein
MNFLPYDSLHWGWIGMAAGIVSGALMGVFSSGTLVKWRDPISSGLN